MATNGIDFSGDSQKDGSASRGTPVTMRRGKFLDIVLGLRNKLVKRTNPAQYPRRKADLGKQV